jgi:hypothetical protein
MWRNGDKMRTTQRLKLPPKDKQLQTIGFIVIVSKLKTIGLDINYI